MSDLGKSGKGVKCWSGYSALIISYVTRVSPCMSRCSDHSLGSAPLQGRCMTPGHTYTGQVIVLVRLEDRKVVQDVNTSWLSKELGWGDPNSAECWDKEAKEVSYGGVHCWCKRKQIVAGGSA